MGFTLIEILIVMVIIGVLATMVSLSIKGRAVDDRMQAESRRLEQLLRMASDEAQALGLEIGFRHTIPGFEFLTPDTVTGEWKLVEEPTFRRRAIPPPFYLELRIDGRLVKPAQPAPVETKGEDGEGKKKSSAALKLNDDDDKVIEPQVLILSSGEMTAFTLDLKLKDLPTYYRLEANAMGEITSKRLNIADDKSK
ncbi:type II secretion system protein GspH [Panacagrimonas perspica]|uniref:pilus assembly FimT family protein n=1 Tax=Panacagrimonas perspica TaxID=381431 RepID=UPI00113EA7B2|nr:prepilin-type N-terminal cleavage/methylation domain-containing protein [Panacagrimonas perspica]THD03182.1 type II secretion system protein GspH [Panacagrimonas perspica]